MKCSFPGCLSSCPDGKTMCFRHGSMYGTATVNAVDKSQQRAEQEKEYIKIKRAYIRANPFCKVKGCTKRSSDVHHMKGRIGTLLNDQQYFFPVCRQHHKIIEKNPLWAKQEGYSVSRLAK